MSADRVTVGELIRELKQLPKTMCVVTVRDFDRGTADGLLDGPEVFVARLREARDGWRMPFEDRAHGCDPIDQNRRDGEDEGETVVVISCWERGAIMDPEQD